MSETHEQPAVLDALVARDEVTPLCLACLSPVDLASYFEDLKVGRYLVIVPTDGAPARSVLCAPCVADPARAQRLLGALEPAEIYSRLVGEAAKEETR